MVGGSSGEDSPLGKTMRVRKEELVYLTGTPPMRVQAALL
jgi:hypothetical protein